MNDYIRMFNDYVSSYDMSNSDIKSKYDHTFRVIVYCEKNAQYLGLNENDIELSRIIGLFHDIGRFEQRRVYDTYTDLESLDHANLGVEIIRDKKILDNAKEKELIVKAIYYHNKIGLDSSLSDREILFSNIVRDADKLDNLDILLNISNRSFNGNISDLVLRDIYSNRIVDRRNVVTDIDEVLVKFGWAFDFNFKFSYEYLKKNKIYETIVDNLIVNNESIRKTLIEIKNIVLDYIDGRND